jgi:hypothetical protein
MTSEMAQGHFDNPQAVLLSRIEAGWEPPPVEELASPADEVHLLESDVKLEVAEEEAVVLLPVVDGMGREHAAAGWFQAVKEELKRQLPRETYNTWIHPAKLVDYIPPIEDQPPMLTIQLHNLYAREWIKLRLHKIVKRIVDRQLAADVTIEYQAPPPGGTLDTEWQIA